MTKILLVEDDPLIYRMYDKAFKLAGYETAIATNGQEGLDKLKTFTPDIILLDIMMPTMNGVEMLAKLKQTPELASIPTVMLTNVSDPRIDHEVFNQGAHLTLIKSETEPDEVIQWIESVLQKARDTAAGGTPPAVTPPTPPAPAA